MSYRTRAKDAIAEYLKQHSDHSFSAYDVNEYMQEKGIQMNLTTVYRNLDRLTESGEIMRYKTAGDEFSRYQCAKPHAGCSSHLHMQCRECGRILHLECGFMQELKEHLEEHHGFALECQGSVLMGLCRQCSADKDKMEKEN